MLQYWRQPEDGWLVYVKEGINMRRYIAIFLLMLFAVGMMLTGCVEKAPQQQQTEPPQQVEQQQKPAETQGEVSTLVGEFIGLADSHSVEILVDGEAREYQFTSEAIGESLEVFDKGMPIQFDVKTDAGQGMPTIVKIYDAPAQG